MEPSPHSKKHIPNYVLISIALVQSELYWFCSVIYCIFRESGLITESTSKNTTSRRNRANSAPPAPKSFKKGDSNDDSDQDQEEQNQRRFSLPSETVNLRQRPSAKDEQVGTTCPPLWWQKTRVKLRRAPVHGDPKPKSILSTTASSSTTPTMISFAEQSTSVSIKRIDSMSPSISYTESPALYLSSSFHANDKISNSSSLTTSPSIYSTASSVEGSPSTSQKKSTTRRFMSKLNAALHHHRRRNNSTDSKKKN